ncbi:Ser-Thr-rich glycosyl-phosphatidyl-inositol-anchored membrane family-domain-containing protein [Umbelopsis sp. PMI_123]|nr:Ser-Thr-rich glycosyl-phosphatidyl-inositol-anchored membrane family-domain-containing protein [Umbelopsis sp. PMI_123]
MKSIIAAVAAFAVAAVSAQTTPPVSITSPLTGTVYTAGGQAIISWINPSVPTLAQIQLAKGPATALQPVGQVATNVQTSDGKYTWTIPADTPAGTDYAFELGTSPNIAYSGFFTIKGGSGSASNSTASGAAASGAAPSGAAASGAGSAAASSLAPAASGSPSSGSPSSGSPSSGSAASGSAASAAAPSSSVKSGASKVKAGVIGAGVAAGTAALLF